MKKTIAVLVLTLCSSLVVAQEVKKPDPAKPEKAEQEPRPVEQEIEKQESEQKDAPVPVPIPVPVPSPAPVNQQGAAAAESAAEVVPEQKAPTWDVSNPLGPASEISIDVTEGTWLSLDVSPDGREIVFDLLGDLYTIPVAGGTARALTNGVAWDMQPKYSPDGKRIAFTSDRAGGDNLWTIDRDGSDPRQVSKETFRLLNSPSWTPDGDYIVGRKHFTSERSLGAGEMWLYHRSGSEGLQMTKKPNDQKDAGEPVFSPDGRYLYYSQDTTPGALFEYNKNPNGQIYVIQRLDRETGDITPFVTGPGGSIRPTPSPDGKQLAFIRRVRTRSVLYLLDLESGAERPIYDGLDRDMQETWAVHGVYPAMAWTPDNRSLVFWAGGKIRRIEVASRQVSDIPFRVQSSRRVAEAVRFPIEVAPSKFPVRMLRWVTVSPRGNQVVYSALGYLYVRDLPNGTPRRLTRQSDHFEFYPTWSRDGRSIAYTTWNDEKLGSVRTLPAGGGEGRIVTTRPGHYVEPSFSPDGSRISFRKTNDGFLTSPLWSRDPGLYVVPTSGGKAILVSKRGAVPQFGAGSDRLFFMTFEDEDKRALRSIDLDGSDERTHFVSERATEFRVSPDEKWVAFRERFNAFITPFVRTGKQVEIGPSTATLPVKQVSKEAGEYLHWSGDGSRLHWSLGPELFSRDLKDAFTFVNGAAEKLTEVPPQATHIGFDENYDAPSGRVAIVGGRLITMRGDEVIEDGVVLIEGNRIVAVGPRSTVSVPAGTRVVDAVGKTIMPGLIDVHWHGSMGTEDIIPQQSWVNLATLAFGVTTLHDPSNNTSEIFTASEMARSGEILAPRIFSTGTILYGAKGSFRAEIESLDDALFHLRRMKAVGAFSVKSYNQPRRDQRQQVIEAARQLQMMVVPEGGSLFQHNLTMVVDGHTGVEHSIPVAEIYADTTQLWGKTKTAYTPTLVVGYGGLWGENYWYQKTDVFDDPRLQRFVPRRVLDARSRRRVMAADEEFNHINNARVAKELLDSGVNIQMGAHGQREGLGSHWELWMFQQGGMTPHQALRAGTLAGAQYLGLDRDLGSLESGKLADLVVLDANPLENIRHTTAIRSVMINGRLFDSLTMREIGGTGAAPRPFWFQQDGNEGWTPRAAAQSSAHDHD